MRRLAGLLLALALGCGSESPAVFSVDVGASGGGPLLVTAIGGTLQLTATPRDASGKALGVPVTWASSNPLVATVSASGLVTGVANGAVDIAVAAGVGRGRATVTVAQAPDSIAVTPPSSSVERGAKVTLTAAVVDSRGNAVVDPVVTWTSADASIAAVSAAGVATGVAVGSTTITATSGAKSASATLAVTVPAPNAIGVSSTQSGALASIDDTRQLTAAATDARGAAIPEAAFTWGSSDTTVASVDAAGLVTARKNGSATITATSGTAHGTIAITVAQATHAVQVGPSSQSIAPDALFTFTAQPLDARAHPVAGAPAATWTVDDSSIATIDAATGQVHGNANATALATTHVHAAVGLVTGTAALTIDPSMAPVVSVSLAQPSGSLASIGDTVQLSPTALNGAGNPVPGVVFSFSSDDGTIASVNPSSGLVTAVGNGSTLVHASGGGKSAQVTITVLQVATQVAIAAPAFTTFTSIDDTLQLSAAVQDAKGHAIAGALVSWGTSDGAVVAVSNTGLATAKANGGPVTITATSGLLHGQVDLSVAQTVHVVNAAPSSDFIAPSTTIDFRAAALDAHGHLVAGAPAATWDSSDPGVVIDSFGHAAVGSFTGAPTLVTITATIAGVQGTASLTVDPTLGLVGQVVVAGGGVSLASLGDTVQLSAQAEDGGGTPLSGHPINWSVQDGSADVVTVDPSGLVTALANGTKTIVAASGGVSGTTTITVLQVLASVVVSTQVAGAPTTLTSFGETLALQAQAVDAKGHPLPPGDAFTWRSDGPAVSVDSAGVVTAVSNGTANVFAKTGAVESAGFAVTVGQAVDHIVVSAGVASTTLASIGQTLQLTATAFDARGNAVAATFIWSPTTGAAAVVDQAGLVTAVANGSANVQASAGGKTGSLTVTVAQAVTSVAVSGPASLTSLNQTAQLTAVAKDAGGTAVPGATFTWRSDAEAKVTVGSTTGVIKAIANGSANVFAKAGLIESAGYPITVAQAVDSIAVTGTSLLTAIDDTTTLTAVALDANANPVPGITLAWSVQDGTTDVVTVGPATGVVTAVSAGQKTIVAGGAGKTGTLLVTVKQVAVAVSVSAGGSSTTLASIGDTVTLSASAVDAHGHPIPDAAFTWRSSDDTRASVGLDSGVVTAVANGTASIFAKADSAESAGLAITVAQVVASVTVTPNPATLSLFYHTTATFFAAPKDARGNAVSGAPAATWASSNTNVATIDSTTGVASPVAVGGPITITGTVAGVDGTAQLTVIPQ